jgi:integral membrane sensor domain MASE1
MTKLRLWQRIAVSLIAYPIIYLIIPASVVINFFIASLLFTAILLLSARWKDTEKAMLPEWEGKESEKNNDQIKETFRNKT